MQTGAAILLGAEALAWIFRGEPGTVGFYMVRITNFIVFVESDLVLFFFHHYLCAYLFPDEGKDRPLRVRAVSLLCAAGVALVVLSQFTGLYYTFDEKNFYQRGEAYVVSALIPLVAMLMDLSLLIQYRSRIKRKVMFALAGYILFPLTALVAQTIWYGFSLNDMAVTNSMVLLFIAAVGEQNESLDLVSRREVMMRERLEIESMLNRCVKELSSDTDIDVSINNLLGIIQDYFESDRTYIFEYNFERKILTNTYEYVKGQVTQQLLAVPLRKSDQIIGFLGVDNPRAHNEDPTLLSSLQYFVTNILERKRKKEYLKAMSYQDMLTGLYNRNRYMEVIDSEASHYFMCVGAAYIDLNGLKRMNDECGHEAGDELIRRCAAVLSEIFPKKCYRVGGDEFVILVPGINECTFYEKIKLIREKM